MPDRRTHVDTLRSHPGFETLPSEAGKGRDKTNKKEKEGSGYITAVGHVTEGIDCQWLSGQDAFLSFSKLVRGRTLLEGMDEVPVASFSGPPDVPLQPLCLCHPAQNAERQVDLQRG